MRQRGYLRSVYLAGWDLGSITSGKEHRERKGDRVKDGLQDEGEWVELEGEDEGMQTW